jgi:hypothetical protein
VASNKFFPGLNEKDPFGIPDSWGLNLYSYPPFIKVAGPGGPVGPRGPGAPLKISFLGLFPATIVLSLRISRRSDDPSPNDI